MNAAELTIYDGIKRLLIMSTIFNFIFRAGVKTTELWITVLAMLLPVIDHFVNPVLTAHDPQLFLWGLLAAVYTFCRGWIKAHATKQISGGVANVTPGGNIVSPGPGKAQEEAHARLASDPGGMDLTKLSRGL